MSTPATVSSGLSLYSLRVAITRVTLCLALIATFSAVANAATPSVVNTFAGGASDDQGQEIAVDSEGNKYVVGTSKGGWGAGMTSFVGPSAAFVAKFDRDGFLVWNTFLGSGSTTANDIAVDGIGNVYVTGESAATWGSPVRGFTRGGFNGTAKDAFAAKLDPQGNVLWNSFL